MAASAGYFDLANLASSFFLQKQVQLSTDERMKLLKKCEKKHQ
jgi:hypothetical protein